MSSSQQDKQKKRVTPDKASDKEKYISFLSQPYDPIDGFNSLSSLLDLNKKISKDVQNDIIASNQKQDQNSSDSESHEKPTIHSGKFKYHQ